MVEQIQSTSLPNGFHFLQRDGSRCGFPGDRETKFYASLLKFSITLIRLADSPKLYHLRSNHPMLQQEHTQSPLTTALEYENVRGFYGALGRK